MKRKGIFNMHVYISSISSSSSYFFTSRGRTNAPWLFLQVKYLRIHNLNFHSDFEKLILVLGVGLVILKCLFQHIFKLKLWK